MKSAKSVKWVKIAKSVKPVKFMKTAKSESPWMGAGAAAAMIFFGVGGDERSMGAPPNYLSSKGFGDTLSFLRWPVRKRI